jgi:hypothetical protein
LKKLCLPASVEKMNRLSLPPNEACSIQIESGNQHFQMKADFLIDLDRHLALRYCGRSAVVSVPAEIEILGEHCLSHHRWIECVELGPMSKLRSIETDAFSYCNGLKSIRIPSSVEFLGHDCFTSCGVLKIVSFCPGSKLASILMNTFLRCGSLESIILPSSVKTLDSEAFAGCAKLRISPVPLDSAMARIAPLAFSKCYSLNSFIVPSSVEFLGEGCFRECYALLNLSFASPSKLRELLDLPPALSGVLAIPDSVEHLSMAKHSGCPCSRVLVFGPESRLSQVRLRGAPQEIRFRTRLFLQLSPRALKVRRMNSEFATHS